MKDINLSKSLSYLLRHGAQEAKLPMSPDGFVRVDEILKQTRFHTVCVDDVRRVVETNQKRRFTLKQDAEARLLIRADQGHSLPGLDIDLAPITSSTQAPLVVHGTSTRAWASIRDEGLKPMGRVHIHFAPGRLGEEGVISGMRASASVFIYINLDKALGAGMRFFRSQNGVILSSGLEWVIATDYFDKVIDKHGNILL